MASPHSCLCGLANTFCAAVSVVIQVTLIAVGMVSPQLMLMALNGSRNSNVVHL